MSDARKDVLVLGGTAYLSKEIAGQAVERGHRVTVAARGESGRPPEGTEFVRIDRSTEEGVEPLRGRSFDAVVDVARIAPQVGRVLKVLGDDTPHWTFVSSVSVYVDPSEVGAATLAPVEPDDEDSSVELYGRHKVACEDLVRARLGDRAFIPRPGLIVGAGDVDDRFGYWPLRLAEGGEVLAPARPERPVQWIDVVDLAAWVLEAIERGVTGTFDAVGEPVTMAAFLDGVAEALIEQGRLEDRPALTWVPQDFLTARGVNPWAGPDSLGMWAPEPEYAGLLARPARPAIEAGLAPSPLGTTVWRWWEANAAAPKLAAGISREREGAVLGAWHDRDRSFAVPGSE